MQKAATMTGRSLLGNLNEQLSSTEIVPQSNE
jgi:hypothetical protein